MAPVTSFKQLFSFLIFRIPKKPNIIASLKSISSFDGIIISEEEKSLVNKMTKIMEETLDEADENEG